MRDIALNLKSLTLTHLKGRLQYNTGHNFKMPPFKICTFLNVCDDDMKRSQVKHVE